MRWRTRVAASGCCAVAIVADSTRHRSAAIFPGGKMARFIPAGLGEYKERQHRDYQPRSGGTPVRNKQVPRSARDDNTLRGFDQLHPTVFLAVQDLDPTLGIAE